MQFYVDGFRGGDLLSDRALKSDRIHPNAKGYRLMAEVLAKRIASAQKAP